VRKPPMITFMPTTVPSRPGEFHPEPLTDPCVSLSTHTARATQRRLPPSADTVQLLPIPVGHTGRYE
jgi:hypothetical protein